MARGWRPPIEACPPFPTLSRPRWSLGPFARDHVVSRGFPEQSAFEPVEHRMPYRGFVVQPDPEELQTLRALARGAKRRSIRAALSLGSIGIALALFASAMVSRRRTQPMCHHVTIVLGQSDGMPPPPMGWTTCEPARDLAAPGATKRRDLSREGTSSTL